MTTKRPSYGRVIKETGEPPRDQSNRYSFWFSDDINDWYGLSKRKRQKQVAYYHARKNEGYKTKHG